MYCIPILAFKIIQVSIFFLKNHLGNMYFDAEYIYLSKYPEMPFSVGIINRDAFSLSLLLCQSNSNTIKRD